MELLKHPSGIEDEAELAYVSAAFWKIYHNPLNPTKSLMAEAFDKLLIYQKGWKAAKDFYKVNT